MTRLIHWIAHLFCWNRGCVYSWWDADTGRLMVGYRCNGCNSITGVYESRLGNASIEELERLS